jgi:signal transduction histidine kinase
MNLKRRLIISNTLTVIIPFIITSVAALIIFIISSSIYNKKYFFQNYIELNKTKSELVQTIKTMTKENPEIIFEREFQNFLMEKLSPFEVQILITKNSNSIFSSIEMNKIDIEKCLEIVKSHSFNEAITLNNINYSVEASEVKLREGMLGNIILLIPDDNYSVIIERALVALVLIFIASLVTVNILMSYTLSKGILKPVALLKKATSEISNGNLDYEIIDDGDEEIKELCNDFETMRIQLKDSIKLRMKYDENRTALISSISHDLKTPITSIKGYVEGILDGVANSPEKMESYLKTIYSKSEQMDAMIDDLLLYSKLDLNQLPFDFKKTDIVEYLEFCVSENALELSKYNIRISLINKLLNSKYVMLDRDRMSRVIMNIIDNSRKYMDKKAGEINVYLRETNLSIIIEIKDNGSGISETDINKIFDRFYRADSARSGIKGSGLGLAIAKQIVEGHKGKIWAIAHENNGTSILISLAKMIQE